MMRTLFKLTVWIGITVGGGALSALLAPPLGAPRGIREAVEIPAALGERFRYTAADATRPARDDCRAAQRRGGEEQREHLRRR